jgi:hypothetical protein
MKKSWKLIPIVALAIGLIIPSSAPAAEDREAFFPASIARENPGDKIFSTGEDAVMSFSSLGQVSKPNGCTSTADPNCDFSDAQWGVKTIVAGATLNICTENENEDCIESIEISRNAEPFTKLVFEKYVTSGTCDKSRPGACTFPPDPLKKLPRGGNLSVWTEVVDGKSRDLKYLAAYSYEMNYDDINKYFVINNVNLAIKPMKEISAQRWDSLWFENGKSGIQYDFPTDLQVRATVHVSKSVVGWFKARMQDVGLEILPWSSTNNRLIVSGKAATVPTFAVVRSESQFTPQETDFAKYFGYGKGVSGGEPGDPRIFEYLDYWRPKFNDIASHQISSWTLKSTRWVSENKCLNAKDRVLGVVSTNAMGYDGNPPKFADGFLNYRVSGFHFGPDGKSPNLGTYDLVLRSDAARCLYGFSNAPVSATVTVAGADGAQNVATTVVTEKDGWLKMKAAGFTFSEKQIKVKITQEPSLTATPAASATPVAIAKKKTTITCVKGKTAKKVTAGSPKCPAGFKKKA